jgi:hypothetical protein
MKNLTRLLGIITLVAAIGLSMTVCDDGSGGGGGSGQTVTYTGVAGGTNYTLKITENTGRYAAQSGDDYELTAGSKKSAGTVNNVNGSVLTLKPSNSSITFTATVSGSSLTALNGTLTWTDNTTATAPGTLTTGGGGENTALNGTWVSEDGEKIVLNNGAFTISLDNVEAMKGTYTISGNNITMTVTQIHGSTLGEDASEIGLSPSQWYTQQQLKTAVINFFVSAGIPQSEAEALYNQEMAPFESEMYVTVTGTVSGNTLIINGDTYTRSGGGQGVTPTITTASLPSGIVGTYYSQTLTASGGTPITWSIESGALPNGLTLSNDAISGTPTTAGTSNFTVKAANSAGSGTKQLSIVIASSGGGMTWTAVTNSPFGTNEIHAIACGNNKFVAVGEGGKMAYSADGITWTAVADSKFDSRIRAIAYGGGKFVAGGNGDRMTYSTDGVNWTAVTDSKFNSNNTIQAIAYGGGKFVAGNTIGQMSYSTDGITWTAVADSKFYNGYHTIYAIAYGNGKFVAAGDGEVEIAYSSDGVNWTVVTDSKLDRNIYAIAYGGGKFIAGSSRNTMVTSSDGLTWTQVVNSPFGALEYIQAIACDGNGKFVAGGDLGKLATSSDGVNWTRIADTTFNSYGINAIAYGNGTFVAGGQNGKMAYSSGN